MQKNLILLSTVMAIAAGCTSTQSIQNGPPTLTAISMSSPFVGKDKEFEELRIATPSDGGKAATAQTLLLLLRGGGTTTYSKDGLIGKKITDTVSGDALKNPIYDIHKRIELKLKDMAEKDEKFKEANFWTAIRLKTTPPLWKLTYEKMLNSDDLYRLNFGAKISRLTPYKKSTLFGKKDSSLEYDKDCTYESAPASLEQWKQDNYAKVTELKTEIVQKCVDEFTSYLPILTISQRKD